MRECRNDQSIDICEDVLHRFAMFRWRRRQLRLQITGFNLRKDRQLVNVFEIVSNPIDEFVPMTAEFLGGHVAQR